MSGHEHFLLPSASCPDNTLSSGKTILENSWCFFHNGFSDNVSGCTQAREEIDFQYRSNFQNRCDFIGKWIFKIFKRKIKGNNITCSNLEKLCAYVFIQSGGLCLCMSRCVSIWVCAWAWQMRAYVCWFISLCECMEAECSVCILRSWWVNHMDASGIVIAWVFHRNSSIWRSCEQKLVKKYLECNCSR